MQNNKNMQVEENLFQFLSEPSLNNRLNLKFTALNQKKSPPDQLSGRTSPAHLSYNFKKAKNILKLPLPKNMVVGLKKNNININKIWVNSLMTKNEQNKVLSIISNKIPEINKIKSENILKIICRNINQENSYNKIKSELPDVSVEALNEILDEIKGIRFNYGVCYNGVQEIEHKAGSKKKIKTKKNKDKKIKTKKIKTKIKK